MKVICRVDASRSIGHGHVMRCLTLAGELKARGAEVAFVCREHEGNLGGLIEERGFAVRRIPFAAGDDADAGTAHASWLGSSLEREERDTRSSIAAFGAAPDWIVVDHYALDERWESAMQTLTGALMVIDDIADRPHSCDLLLDQNLVRGMASRYGGLVPEDCSLLLGPAYALLQPAYAELHSRAAPRKGPARRLFVSFGAADRRNLCGRTINAIISLGRTDLVVDVVVSSGSPHEAALREMIGSRPDFRLHVGVPTLAPFLAGSDLGIGAGGVTVWERLCLGLPSLVITLAENQCEVVKNLDSLGLVRWLGDQTELSDESLAAAIDSVLGEHSLEGWSLQCLAACDGRGVYRVADAMMERCSGTLGNVGRAPAGQGIS